MRPALGISRPSSMAIVVVLPAPLPPSSPTVSPGATREADPVHREHFAVALGQPFDRDRVHGATPAGTPLVVEYSKCSAVSG